MDEKRKAVEDTARKFGELDASSKSFVLGYLLGKQEQAAKRQEQEEKRPV